VSELDANTGRIIWKTYSIAQRPQRTHKNSLGVQQWAPAGVPIWNTPTVDPAHHAVYVGTGDASTYPAPPTTDAILALDMKTGKRLWTHQVYPGDSFIVVSRRGATAWQIDRPATSRGGGAVWGGAMDESTVYVPGGRRGIAAFGIADGQRKWSVSPGGAGDEKVEYTAAITAIPGVLFVGASDGGVWALSSADGRALWSYQSAHAFTTVNAVAAHGGSIASAGATVAGGMLLVGSGYGVIAGTPGNVLLAFGVQ
jgi:polyvinyl alcohol dehydrogenase (cytochrome)